MLPENRKLLHTLPVQDMELEPCARACTHIPHSFQERQGQVVTRNGLWEAVGPQLGLVRRNKGSGLRRTKFLTSEVFVQAHSTTVSLLGTRWSVKKT